MESRHHMHAKTSAPSPKWTGACVLMGAAGECGSAVRTFDGGP